MPKIHPVAYDVWQWWLVLNIGRNGGITNTEIKAFFELEGITPTSWQLQLLRSYEMEAISFWNAQKKP